MFKYRRFSLISLLVILVGINVFPSKAEAIAALSVSSPLTFNFNNDEILVESGSSLKSTSPYWWVNSGAMMMSDEGRGKTIHGALDQNNPWRILYAAANPTDTDNGYHPQNIFRLVSRSTWKDFRQQVYFKITKDQLSSSSNRNASNGLLLFNRYLDGDNLYYTGLRVDGYAVIKKKIAGIYHTLSYVRVFPGTYNRNSKPNLLPKNTWIGLRSEVVDNPNGSVSIKLYIDIGWNNNWKLVAQVTDDGRSGSVVSGAGFGGIRTDFMDLIFDAYKMESI